MNSLMKMTNRTSEPVIRYCHLCGQIIDEHAWRVYVAEIDRVNVYHDDCSLAMDVTSYMETKHPILAEYVAQSIGG
jgi:hypothetical protein